MKSFDFNWPIQDMGPTSHIMQEYKIEIFINISNCGTDHFSGKVFCGNGVAKIPSALFHYYVTIWHISVLCWPTLEPSSDSKCLGGGKQLDQKDA